MPVFDVPIIRTEVAEALYRHFEGEDGRGPKMPHPDIQPKIIKVAASSRRDAAALAERRNPGWIATPANVMKARNA